MQVHNIPLGYMDKETAEEICSTTGKVVKTSGDMESGGGGFIRVKVTIDVTQPLCQGRMVTLENRVKTWVSFKYERLPNLCYYYCVCLEHDDKDCEVWIQSEGTLEQVKKKYDSSIRAKPVYPSSKNLIQVPGYYEVLKKKHMKLTAMPEERPPMAEQETTT